MDDKERQAPDTPDLGSPACYPHPVSGVKTIETHISRVFLTGEYAYKLKKPVALGFLDFTTLEARRRCCEDEVRLNRRFAPALYLGVVTVNGTPAGPRIQGEGPIIDYAVKMREFAQADVAAALLARGALHGGDLDALARRIARFHAEAPSDAGPYGTPAAVRDAAEQNFMQIRPHLRSEGERARLERLRAWTEGELGRLGKTIGERHGAGRVREVHGDLHLGNIVRVGGELVPFDCLEFNASLRWNDVMSEVAFVVMDLDDRGAPALGHVFLDAYLEESGDYEGLAVLRFFMVYRAVVRAKIHLMRAAQVRGNRAEQRRLRREYRRYLAIAASYTRPRKPFLVLMHGLAASGKSTVARALSPALGAVRLRSDVERKRLARLPAHTATGSPVGGGLYTAERSEATYARLAALAAAALDARFPVVADATFLRAADRDRLVRVARARALPWTLVAVDAPIEVLRERLVARAASGADASEANAAVLEHQLAHREPFTPAEGRRTIAIDGREGLSADRLAAIARRLGRAGGEGPTRSVSR